MAVNKDQIIKTFFTFEGRINRQKFWIYTLILFGAAIAATLILGIIGGILGISGLTDLIVFLINIGIAVATFSIAIRRWHDLDQTGWLSLLYLLPLINVLAFLYIGIMKGTPGSNKYGADPLQ